MLKLKLYDLFQISRGCYVILFFDINLNIIYLTKHINSDILITQSLKITIYFSYFLQYVCNVLKIILWPVFKHPDVLQN